MLYIRQPLSTPSRYNRPNTGRRHMIKWIASILATVTRRITIDPVRAFQLSVLTLGVIILFATGGYMLIEGMSAGDALYMTMITVTTVGYGEVVPLSPSGRAFTMLVILLGVAGATTTISSAIGIVLGPRLWKSIRLRNMERVIMMMENHYIVCGYGRMGRQISEDLIARGESFIVVDASPEIETLLLEDNIPFIIGDATQDDTMIEAGVERARGLVSALDTDADNVMTVLTARGLNPRLLIVARVMSAENEVKLRRAGANRVVSPYQIGGHRIALALLRPAVSDFLDRIFAFHEDLDVDIGQVIVRDGSPLAGQTVASCDLRRAHNVTILAIQKPPREIILTPSPAQLIEPGVTLIIIGSSEKVYELERLYARAE